MLIADGMSMSTLTCADIYSRNTRQIPLEWIKLLHSPLPELSLMNMQSLNSIVTDSAAASSSWSSGCRVNNGTLNTLPDGKLLRPLLPILKENGWKIGVATTTTVTHATPAGFLIANPARGAEGQIAEQYLTAAPDVALGGGLIFFPEGLQKSFISKGYTLCKTADELLKSGAKDKLLGLFDEGHMTYCIDRKPLGLEGKLPSLGQMTQIALRNLSASGDKFFLQVEGGRVDHAAHANDAGAIVHEMLDFDGAVKVALEFQQKNPDTLVIITTDHGNANMGVNGMGGAYLDSDDTFTKVAGFNASIGRIIQEMGVSLDNPDNPLKGFNAAEPLIPDKVISTTEKYTGIKISDDHAKAFCAMVKPGKDTPAYLVKPLNAQFANPVNLIAQILSNYTGVGWTGSTHTSDFVPLTATGPGQEQFAGFLQNTDIFAKFMKFAGVKFSNS